MSKQNHIISKNTPVSSIIATEEFSQLDKKEKEYTYHLYKASWEGTKICFFQKSWESPALFYILQQVFNQPLETLKSSSLANGITEEDYTKIICYCASIIQNSGNYKNFGDSKILPEISEEIFYKFISLSKCFENKQTKDKINNLWERIKKFVYNFEGIYGFLGLYPQGLSGYYAHEITKEEVLLVDEFLQIIKISPLNTRIGKISNKEYIVLIASANSKKKSTHFYKENKIHVTYGDFAPFLRRISKSLEKAYENASNNAQKKMIDYY